MGLTSPFAFFHEGYHEKGALFFSEPVVILSLLSFEDADEFFRDLEHALRRGYHLAGYFSYELGFSLEPRLHRFLSKNSKEPLARIGVFSRPKLLSSFETLCRSAAKKPCKISPLKPSWTFETYQQKFLLAQQAIMAGDLYQINLSFPMIGTYEGSPLQAYTHLKNKQNTQYTSVLNFGDEFIVSFSPELFFKKNGQTIETRPMKGTMRRGKTEQEDKILAQSLLNHSKQRAENLMIVDLMRNDLSKICQIGTVKTPHLFTLEQYPTLHQMTSSVVGTLRPSLSLYEIFQALFPSGSITGAPKIRAMELIEEFEATQRGIYCGAIGFIAPNQNLCWNVAIRTLHFKEDQTVKYSVGSGVVAYSDAASEYQECLLKAQFLQDTHF